MVNRLTGNTDDLFTVSVDEHCIVQNETLTAAVSGRAHALDLAVFAKVQFGCVADDQTASLVSSTPNEGERPLRTSLRRRRTARRQISSQSIVRSGWVDSPMDCGQWLQRLGPIVVSSSCLRVHNYQNSIEPTLIPIA